MHWTAHHNVVGSTLANVIDTPVPPAINAHVNRAWNRVGFSSRRSKVLSRSTPYLRSVSGISAASTFSNVVAKCSVPHCGLHLAQMTQVGRISKIRSKRLRFGVRPSVKAATGSNLLPFLPISLNCHELERAGRVKGGAAAERSEGTLDAPEHSNRLIKGNGGRPDFIAAGSDRASPEQHFVRNRRGKVHTVREVDRVERVLERNRRP